MLLLLPYAFAAPFVGATVHGSVPVAADYVVPAPLGGAYVGATFPRMGFEVRGVWGTGAGDFEYALQASHIDGLHLFSPEERFDPFLVYGLGYRALTFRKATEKEKARHLGVVDDPAVAGFGEAGGGLIVHVVGPLHARADARLWLGRDMVSYHERMIFGFDATLSLEVRPVKPRDMDGDGYLDRDDTCPTDAEDFDHLLDKDGCPDVDVDRDGIPDQQDRCPTQPEARNDYEDLDGCPDIVPAAVAVLPPPLRAFSGTVEGIVFALDSAEILPASEPVLAAGAKVLGEYPEVRVVVRGHTDSTADDAYNLSLSRARAETVVAWLVAHGVAPDRFTAEGLGETQPIDTNETEEGRARNRRVEFVIVTP